MTTLKTEDVAARWTPAETGAEADGLLTLELSGGPDDLFEGTARQALERSVLPPFLRGQRWFGGKARRIESVRLADWGRLRLSSSAKPQAAPAPQDAFLTLFEVRFGDDSTDLYFVPLAVTAGAGAARLLQSMRPRVLARLTGPDGAAVLHDALDDEDACRALLDAVATGQGVALRAGRVRAEPTAAFERLRGRPEDPLPVARGPETSSNSLVLFGRRLLLKLFRRLEPGTNPDFEIGRFLTERGTFRRIPQVAGAVEYHRSGGPSEGTFTLAILQALVENQGDGWRVTLDELGRYFQRASGRTGAACGLALGLAKPQAAPGSAAEPPPAVRETVGPYLYAAGTLGRRTAELHRALAADPHEPAFAPEPMTADDVAALAAEVREQGRRALVGMREGLGQLPADVAAAARRFLDEAPAALARWSETPGVRPGAVKIRCHGDYHLGQVLVADNDFVILDFEGEPTRTVLERRLKQSPLKDVAGMLRSFDYAAYAGLLAFTHNAPDEFAPLEPWAELWRQWVSAAFLREYQAAAGATLPPDPGQFAALLDAFMLAKALYELVYELNNRPDWVRIPLRGILSLLGRSAKGGGQ
jgi:maltose alpha-D-glucosyltransferase/alpha-amylase